MSCCVALCPFVLRCVSCIASCCYIASYCVVLRRVALRCPVSYVLRIACFCVVSVVALMVLCYVVYKESCCIVVLRCVDRIALNFTVLFDQEFNWLQCMV